MSVDVETVETLFPPSVFEKAQAERLFWAENRERFLALYPEQHVAARDGEIIAAEHGIVALVDALHEQGLKPTEVAIKLISAKTGRMIL